jgi:hypothetical protein
MKNTRPDDLSGMNETLKRLHKMQPKQHKPKSGDPGKPSQSKKAPPVKAGPK